MRVALFFAFIFCLITASAQSDITSQIVQNTFEDFAAATQGTHIYTGSFLPEMKRQTDVVGSRYLLNGWVNAVVTDTANRVIDNPQYLFNYDKISKTLLVTKDRYKVMEINTMAIKSFVLERDTANITFENLPFISNEHFVEQLVKGNRYSLYKSIKTRFVKSDYFSDGLVERGDPDDVFVDEVKYYVVMPGVSAYWQIEPNRKAIKKSLSAEISSVKAYLSVHKYEDVNQEFLKGLVVFLNQ